MDVICKELCDACMAQDTDGDGTGCDNETAMVLLLNDPSSFEKIISRKRKHESLTVDTSAKRSRRTEGNDDWPSPRAPIHASPEYKKTTSL